MPQPAQVDRWCEEHRFLSCPPSCNKEVKAKKPNKHGAVPKTVDGHQFPSTKEANRYLILKQKLQFGQIKNLKLQARFPLYAYNEKSQQKFEIGKYIADFSYNELSGEFVVEDAKGRMLDKARWKIKHFELQEGIKVRIV